MVFAILSTLGFGLFGLAVFLYYQRIGQFEDAEETKYQIFHEDEDLTMHNLDKPPQRSSESSSAGQD